MIERAKFRGYVHQPMSILIQDELYYIYHSTPSMIPPVPYDLNPYLNQTVVVEGNCQGHGIFGAIVWALEDYRPLPPPNKSRLGTTFNPEHQEHPIKWRSQWSFTHAIEPPPDEAPPWNDAFSRYPEGLHQILEFLDIESTARYQPRQGQTGAAIWVSDVTRMMHCEIPLDPIGQKKWNTQNPEDMVRYIQEESIPKDGWRSISVEDAQERANQGYPVVAFREQTGGFRANLAVVVPGHLNSHGFPLVSQANYTCYRAGRWEDPEIIYITHE